MKVWYNALWQNWQEELPDDEFVQRELALLDQIEGLGFDGVGSPEHHFDADYSACPDHFQIFSYLAGRTTKLQFMLSAVILPWHDPLRVIERVSILDHLSGGRVFLGFGRGLARVEYEGMRVDMNESRERFDEAAAMVIRGLRSGVAENDGPFYPQPRIEVRPRATRSFDHRLCSVGMSPDSALKAADLKAALLCFTTLSIEEHMPMILAYKERYEALHEEAPPPVLMADFAYVHEDAETATREAMTYIERYHVAVVRHYEFAGTHFDNTKGYAAYAEGAKALRDAGMEAATQAFFDVQAGIGTPEQVIERYRHRVEVMAAEGVALQVLNSFKYGGMPVDVAERSLHLYAREVLPSLQALDQEVAGAAIA